jgi:hypothetical protein
MKRRRFSWPDLVARSLKGAGHASIFYLLTLPFVVFSTCGGPTEEYTGYQALRGIPFQPAEWDIDPSKFSGFGHDWWVAGIMAIAILAIATCIWGGVEGAFAGIALAIAGFVCVGEAINFFAPPPMGFQWSPESATGSGWIIVVYAGSIVVDLSWLAAKSWGEVRRARRDPASYQSGWAVLAVLSTLILAVIAVGVLGIVAMGLSTNRS